MEFQMTTTNGERSMSPELVTFENEPAARVLRRRLLSDEMIDGLLDEVADGGLSLTQGVGKVRLRGDWLGLRHAVAVGMRVRARPVK